MLRLDLFRRRNFAFGNLETLTMYAGLAILFFFLVIFLQEVAGYSAVEAGLTTVPATVIMFLLSSRMGALADRYGPRWFMAGGPLHLVGRDPALPALRDRDLVPRRPAAGARRVRARALGARWRR